MQSKAYKHKEIENLIFNRDKLPTSCLLCSTGRLNRAGHIIPELILRWTRRKSGKENFFFYPMNPDLFDALREMLSKNEWYGLPVGDLITCKMLCDRCEEKFSDYEKHFTDKYFKRYYRGNEVGELDSQTYLLIISIAWRVLATTKMMTGQENLEKICRPIELELKMMLQDESFLAYGIHGPSVNYFTIEDLKEFAGHDNTTAAFDYSIEQHIFTHHIYSKYLPANYNKISIAPITTILLKLGRYYFFICQYDYFDEVTFNITRERVADGVNLFKFRMNEDLLSFISIAGGDDIRGMKDYTFKEIDFQTRKFPSYFRSSPNGNLDYQFD